MEVYANSEPVELRRSTIAVDARAYARCSDRYVKAVDDAYQACPDRDQFNDNERGVSYWEVVGTPHQVAQMFSTLDAMARFSGFGPASVVRHSVVADPRQVRP